MTRRHEDRLARQVSELTARLDAQRHKVAGTSTDGVEAVGASWEAILIAGETGVG